MNDLASRFLPYAQHCIEEEDIAAVAEVLRSEFLTQGPAVERFERGLEEIMQVPHAVACANGTAALHLAAMALDFGPGDVAIVPSVTFVATANAIRYCDGIVVFADVDPDTGLLTEETFAKAIARAPGRVKAVLPVHLNGQSVDMTTIGPMADRHGIAVIEDSCHAIGGTQRLPDGREVPIGACGAGMLSTFSFHPAKTVAAGEGGAVTTHDPELARCLRMLRTHGLERDPSRFEYEDRALDENGAANPWYYELQTLGFNYRMPDVLCALGLSQLNRLTQAIKRRNALARYYDMSMGLFGPHVRMIRRVETGQPAWHVYPAMIDFDALGTTRAAVMNGLRERGIGSQLLYIPVHSQPYYENADPAVLSGAERYAQRALALPFHHDMTEADVSRVAKVLGTVLRLG